MTACKQSFNYDTVDGRPLILFRQWIYTLSEHEQQEFHMADKRQKHHRQVAIDDGLMYIDKNDDYIWRDSITGATNKPNDDVWLRYFKRYQEECGVVFSTQFTEE